MQTSNPKPDSKPDLAAPRGELALQTFSMPKDTNANGDIFGGWLVSQMDIAAGISSKRECQGRSVTVSIRNVNFLKPVGVGDVVSCYTEVVKRGRTSLEIAVEVWTTPFDLDKGTSKVGDGLFVFVAIDDNGKPRALPHNSR